MFKNNERTQYVYENKGNMDKVPDQKSDIYVEMTRFLQKKWLCDMQNARERFANVIPAPLSRIGSLFRN